MFIPSTIDGKLRPHDDADNDNADYDNDYHNHEENHDNHDHDDSDDDDGLPHPLDSFRCNVKLVVFSLVILYLSLMDSMGQCVIDVCSTAITGHLVFSFFCPH